MVTETRGSQPEDLGCKVRAVLEFTRILDSWPPGRPPGGGFDVPGVPMGEFGPWATEAMIPDPVEPEARCQGAGSDPVESWRRSRSRETREPRSALSTARWSARRDPTSTINFRARVTAV